MLTRLFFAAFVTLPLVAEELEFLVERDSFAEIATFTLSNGAICRKIDTYDSPYPLRWHLQSAWNQIQFEPEKGISSELTTAENKQWSHCQTGIKRKMLVGPLTKGEWKAFGIQRGAVVRFFPVRGKTSVPEEKGIFRFEISKPGIMRTSALRYGNNTGVCREYAELILKELEKSAGAKKILVHIFESVNETEKTEQNAAHYRKRSPRLRKC